AAQALDVFRRTLDEETARGVEDPEAVRAAIRRHFVVDPATGAEGTGAKSLYASAVNLAGAASLDDDAVASLYWLPLFEAVARHDSTYRRTVKNLGAAPGALAQQCARLLGPDSKAVLAWFRRAPLDA